MLMIYTKCQKWVSVIYLVAWEEDNMRKHMQPISSVKESWHLNYDWTSRRSLDSRHPSYQMKLPSNKKEQVVFIRRGHCQH